MGENAGIEQGGQTQGPETQGTGGTPPANGAQQQGEKPYAQYLNEIPEGLRPVVDGVFAKWDADTTKKFQDLNGQISGVAPYKEFIDGWEPEALKFATGIASQLETQEGAEQLFQQLAGALGYEIDGQTASAGNGQEPEENGQPDLFSDPRFKNLEEGVGKVAEMFTQQQQQAQQKELMAQVEAEWKQAVETNKAILTGPDGQVNKEAESLVMQIAAANGGDINKAFESYSKVVGSTASAANAPGNNAPIVGGGAQNSMPSNVVDIAKLTDAQRKELALATVRARNAQQT